MNALVKHTWTNLVIDNMKHTAATTTTTNILLLLYYSQSMEELQTNSEKRLIQKDKMTQ